MSADHDSDPVARQALQASIYREKILRAREMTRAERLETVIECSNFGLNLMFSGIKHSNPSLSDEETWAKAGQRIDRIRKVRDYNFQGRLVDIDG
jgi:hypothetical protein